MADHKVQRPSGASKVSVAQIIETAVAQNKKRHWRRRRSGRIKPEGWGEKYKCTIRDFFPDLVRITNEPSRFEPRTPCWLWMGSKNEGGYGTYSNGGKYWLVHRLSFLLQNGGFKGKRCVCHSCDNPACCNPEHLWAGTDSENQLDRIKWSATLKEEEMAVIEASELPTTLVAQQHKITKAQVRVIRPRGPMIDGKIHLTRRNYWTGEDPSNV